MPIVPYSSHPSYFLKSHTYILLRVWFTSHDLVETVASAQIYCHEH